MRPTFFPRLFAGIIDLMILAVPLSVFISFLSVALGISTAFLGLNPGQSPHEILLRIWGSVYLRDFGVLCGDQLGLFCGVRKFEAAGDTGEAVCWD